MNYNLETPDDIKDAILDPSFMQSNVNVFAVLKALITLYNESGYTKPFQNVFFTALENRKKFEPFDSIVISLVRDIGLFPYVVKDLTNIRDLLAANAFLSPDQSSGRVVFHYPQAKIFNAIVGGENVILSAPTSFGKSLIIDAIIATNIFDNIVIIVPTLALIDETRKRLAKFSNQYKILTHPSQQKKTKNVYIVTQERVMIDGFIEDVDFFVIDEFYKLQPSEKEDQRCDTLNLALYKMLKRCKRFYMLGPNIENVVQVAEGSISYKFYKEDFPTVGSQLFKEAGEPTAEKIISIYNQTQLPTLVYCSSPKSTTELAQGLAKLKSGTSSSRRVIDALCSWLKNNYHKDWSLIECLKSGIGVHHARLPRALSQFFVELFNKGYIEILVCTSTLIEGVNTAAKNIVMQSQKLGPESFDYFTFNNVAGRAGRMFKYFIGNIYIFSEPPHEKLPFVDIPTISQGDDTSINILLGMDKEDIKEPHIPKIQSYYNADSLLPVEVIKNNSPVNPDKQIELAQAITSNLYQWHAYLSWSTFPEYEQLEFLCQLMFEYFNGRNLGQGAVFSHKQLCFLINRLKDKQPTADIIQADISNPKYKTSPDEAITKHLTFLRLWANYHFPQLAMVISRIQEFIYKKNNMVFGDYSLFAAKVESFFYDPAIVLLEEYGLPMEVTKKVEGLITSDGSLDGALDRLKNIQIDTLPLSGIEKLFIRRAAKSI